MNPFERQLGLEDEYQAYGYKKVLKNDHRNKERSYGSHTSFGNIVRRELTGYLAEYLKSLYQEIEAGETGIGYQDLYHAFNGREINWNRVSHIGLVTLLDYLFHTSKSMSTVHLRIGQRLQDDLRLRFFMKADEDLYQICERRYMRASASYRQKVYSTKKLFTDQSKKQISEDGDYSLQYQNWTENTCRKVGAWIAAGSQAVFKHLTQLELLDKRPIPGKGKSIDWAYCLHEEVRDIEASNQVHAGLMANYQDNPMVCPPADWDLERPGGFLSNSVTERYPLIRGRGTTVPSETALKALNNVQQVPWRINTFVLEQLNYFYAKGESVNDDDPFKPFQQPEEYNIPKMPRHLVDLEPLKGQTGHDKTRLEALHAERKKAMIALTKYYNEQADRRRNGRIHQLVWDAANRFSTEERFWIPWSYDFRTRMYPISILNPQSGNHINGLMEFADGYPVDEKTRHWLSVHVATTKGFSKETFDGRVAWVDSHHKEITLVATDPLGEGRRYWTEEADEPWTYLAACREYFEIFIEKSKTVTHIPCGLDATASGLQILGGLMGDESTCQLVNVLPTKKPSDLYQAVIDKTVHLIKEDRPRRRNIPLDQLTRKVAKAPTMTLAYGSTPWRRKKQIQQVCNGKRGLELGLKWEKISYIAEKLDEAIGFVLPGVTFTLKWLQEVAVASMDQRVNPGKTMVLWTTPAGSEVHQRYFKSKFRQVKTIALGMTKYHQPRVYSEGDKADTSKIESSTAANFVHSLDASIFQIASQDVSVPFSLTHDCFYARAGEDLEELQLKVKEAFIEVVKGDCLQNFAADNGLAHLGEKVWRTRNYDFDYDSIRKSEFLFC